MRKESNRLGGKPSLSSLREQLKRKELADRRRSVGSLNNFPSLKVRRDSAEKAQLNPSFIGFSRDISHMQGQVPIQNSAELGKEMLLSALNSELEQSGDAKHIYKYSNEYLDEQGFYRAILSFVDEDNVSKEGLARYSKYTKQVCDTLKEYYNPGFNIEATLLRVTTNKELLTQQFTGIREVELISNWLSILLDKFILKKRRPAALKVRAALDILKVALEEIIRQVTVQCVQRGEVLEKLVQIIEVFVSMKERDKCNENDGNNIRLNQYNKEQHQRAEETAKNCKEKLINCEKMLTQKDIEIENLVGSREELLNNIALYNKRIDYLEKQLKDRKTHMLKPRKPKSEGPPIVKRHASTETNDKEFPVHVDYHQLRSFHPQGIPLLLTGYFESPFRFKKICGYKAQDNQIIPYDFSLEYLVMPQFQDAATSTAEPGSLSTLPINQYKEIEAPFAYFSIANMSQLIGLYSLSLTQYVISRISKGCQYLSKPPLSMTQSTEISIEPTKQLLKPNRKQNSSIDFDAKSGKSRGTRLRRKASNQSVGSEKGSPESRYLSDKISRKSSISESVYDNPFDSQRTIQDNLFTPSAGKFLDLSPAKIADSIIEESVSLHLSNQLSMVQGDSPSILNSFQQNPISFAPDLLIPPQLYVTHEKDNEGSIIPLNPPVEVMHPGPTVLKHYMLKRKPSEPYMNLRQIMKIINKAYSASRSKATAFACGVYDVLIEIYGLKSVAEEKMKLLISGCLALGSQYVRIQNFQYFLGITQDSFVSEYNFFIDLMEYSTLNIPLGIFSQKEADTERFILHNRLMMFIDWYFSGKLSQGEYTSLYDLAANMQTLPIEYSYYKLEFLKVNIDTAFQFMLPYFKSIKIAVLNYLHLKSEHKWESHSVFTLNEFNQIIYEVNESPDPATTLFFNSSKQRLLTTDSPIITLEVLTSFLIDNCRIRWDVANSSS